MRGMDGRDGGLAEDATAGAAEHLAHGRALVPTAGAARIAPRKYQVKQCAEHGDSLLRQHANCQPAGACCGGALEPASAVDNSR